MTETYYHGCSEVKHGEQIITDGYLKPGNDDINLGRNTPGTKLAPMIGRTYVTPILSEAVVYCIGGSMIGKDVSDWKSAKDDPYGYLFAVDSSAIKDPLPDEDYVGKLINIFYEIGNGTNFRSREVFNRNAIKWRSQLQSYFMSFAKTYLTPLQYRKACLYDDYADFAVAGKKLNKYMSDSMKEDIIKLGCPISQAGKLKISSGWKFDKSKCPDLHEDATNFFELAEKIL